MLARSVEFFVVDDGEGMLDTALEIVGALRRKGLSAEYSYKRQNVGKQMKAANRCGARRVVIARPGGVSVKDMTAGTQVETSLEAFLGDPTVDM